jgi:LysW-gamma-L-lysine carboxypeptidase
MDDVALLEALLSIPSPAGQEDAVATFLVEQMAALGFLARRDEVGNAVGMVGDPGAERRIVLLGHMDTVPGLIAVRQEGGRLYGRGAVDAKGPLVAFVLAAARVAPHLHQTQVVVIGAVEEEAHSRGARHLAQSMPPPTCTVIGEPSDWQSITLGYKGSLSIDYRLRQPAAHTAGQEPGPAEKAVAFWNRLAAYAQAQNGRHSGRFHTLDPALNEVHTVSDGLNEGVDMHIGVRIPPGFETPNLEAKLQTWRNGARLTLHPSYPPFQAGKNTSLVRAMLQAIRGEGGRPRFKLKTGTSDMNIVGPAWGCPIIAYGPGDSALDHTPEEHIDIDEFRRSIDVLARALEILARAKQKLD